MTTTTTELPPYRRPADEVVAELTSDARLGLSADEARSRLERYGPNELESTPPVPAWRRFLAQFSDTTVQLLLVATAVSIGLWLYEREEALPYEGLAILSIVLLNAILGFTEEASAERSLAALRALAGARARVIRGGEQRSVETAELVPGDLLVIEEGDTIPADARLVESVSLQAAESTLTGESLPVEKVTEPVADEVGVGERLNMVFSGTTATYGHGRAVVVATGMDTQVGHIAGLLDRTVEEETPLQRELDQVGRRLGIVVVIIAVVVAATILLTQSVTELGAIVDVLILAVALAVAAVPEGLPAVVTTTLAIGVRRIARRDAIVRKLPAVETLGSATVIASDKTGTLTRNEMTVRVVATASGRVNVEGSGYAVEGRLLDGDDELQPGALRDEVTQALSAAARANNATLTTDDAGRPAVLGDPTEGALLVAARKAGLETGDADLPRVGEVPFSSERKRMSALVQADGRRVLFTKGAPDVVLTLCTAEQVGGEVRVLDEARRATILATIDTLAGEALRTLGAARRELPASTGAVDDSAEEQLVFLGLIGMIDPPRTEVATAVQEALTAGIRPIMITGDHPGTAIAIARELGITDSDRALVGADLQRMSDAELDDAVREVDVYARVDPEHKLRIVQALQRDGAVVSMTGDGVNDAPALRAADIGVAMGITGTDVAKEAADMVLVDDNFATIVAAVEEGRGIFANIRKFLRYLLSSNVGEVLTMFFGVVLGGVLGLAGAGEEAVTLPLLATQILWINLVTDGFPALALGMDPAAPDVMRQRPRPRGEGVITTQMWLGIAQVGLVMAVGTLGVLDAGLAGGLIPGDGDLDTARTMAFTTLVFFQLFNVFNARSDTRSAFAGLFHNPLLWLALAVSLSLQFVVVYTPALQRAFATVGLSAAQWLLCAAVASSVLWVRELTKLVLRGRTAMGVAGSGEDVFAVSDRAVPPLTDDDVRAVIERSRR